MLPVDSCDYEAEAVCDQSKNHSATQTVFCSNYIYIGARVSTTLGPPLSTLSPTGEKNNEDEKLLKGRCATNESKI